MPCKIVIGSSGIFQAGWIPTEIESLNVIKENDWKRYVSPNEIDAMLAEHVWEHMTEQEGRKAAALCFRYLKPGGYIRVAVPDGLHPDRSYIEQVRVGGSDNNGHKVLYTYKTLGDVFTSAGFRVELLEYFDEQRTFHEKNWHVADGMIHRSKRFDGRNRDGVLRYTSLVLDAWKNA